MHFFLVVAATALSLISPQSIAGIEEAIAAFNRKDYPAALTEFQALAGQGNPRAAYALGVMYLKGEGVRQDDKLAFQWFDKAAMANHTSAQVYLGFLYAKGKGVPMNPDLAFAWYSKSAKAGHPIGEHYVGMSYESGEGVEKNLLRALEWYQRAAEHDNVHSLFRLYQYYRFDTKPTDLEKSRTYIIKAAELGHIPAVRILAQEYAEGGSLVPANLAQANKLWAQGAELGDAISTKNLAVNHLNGAGAERSCSSAIKIMESAANKGVNIDFSTLGHLYENLEEYVVSPATTEQDREVLRGLMQNRYRSAAYWYRRAIEAGDKTYANQYINLNREDPDQDKAKALVEQLAKSGNGYAAYILSTEAKDKKSQLQWLNTAALSGYGNGQLRYGEALLDSKDRKTVLEGVGWVRKARDESRLVDAGICKRIGDMYFEGKRLGKNEEEALFWYELASRHNTNIAKELGEKIRALSTSVRRKQLDEAYPLPFKRVTELRPHKWNSFSIFHSELWSPIVDNKPTTFDNKHDFLVRQLHADGLRPAEVVMSCLDNGYNGLKLKFHLHPEDGVDFWNRKGQPFIEYKLNKTSPQEKASRLIQHGVTNGYLGKGKYANELVVFVMNPAEFNDYRASKNAARGLLHEMGLFDFASSMREIEKEFQGSDAPYSATIPLNEALKSNVMEVTLPWKNHDPIQFTLDREMVQVYAHKCSGLASDLDVREAAIREELAIVGKASK